jgi:hypothetical protein
MADQINTPINYPVIAGGKIVVGGKVLFGNENQRPDEDNPATLKAIFVDSNLTVQAQNPQPLGSNGEFDQSVNGTLYGPDNAVYSVLILDRKGKELSYTPSFNLNDTSAATSAAASAAAAAASESNAANSESAAAAIGVEVASSYVDFVNRYFGAYSSDPSVDPVGNPPNEGSIYFNTTSDVFYTWDGSTWVNYFPSNPNGLLVTTTGTTEARTLADRFAETINVKDFGAVCDGIIDDTAAVQSALDTSATVIIIPDLCLTSATLTSTKDNRTIITTGAGLINKTEDTSVLVVTGSGNKIHVKIDGNNAANEGVKVTGDDFEVSSCEIQNLYGLNDGCRAIYIDGNIGGLVSDNTIKNTDSFDNGGTGDAIGSSRAVLVASSVARTKQVLISNNRISDILGEEGDAIQVIANDGTVPFLDGNTVISGNMIHNCNRRAVKIQASNVLVIGNVHTNSLALGQLPLAVRSWDIIGSNNVKILNNVSNVDVAFAGVGISGTSLNRLFGNVVSGNTFKTAEDITTIFCTYADGTVITDNTITGALTCIAVGDSQYCDISGNRFYGGVPTSPAINLVSSVNKCSVENNKMMYGSRSSLVQNSAPYSHVNGNVVLHSDSNTSAVRLFSAAVGSVYRDNNSNGNGVAIFFNAGEADGQFIMQHLGTGTAGSVTPSLTFTSVIPSIENPTQRQNDGDIAFKRNGTAAGKVGWVCVASGTPGTWREFGAVDA